MDQAGIVTIIDEALERFASRDLIGSSEVVDFLLDLRSAVVSDAALAALIESETEARALSVGAARVVAVRSGRDAAEFADVVQ